MPCLVLFHEVNKWIVIQLSEQPAIALNRGIFDLSNTQATKSWEALDFRSMPTFQLACMSLQASPGDCSAAFHLEDQATLRDMRGPFKAHHWDVGRRAR